MVRTQIQLEERQAEMLKQIAAERELSVAELIRRSIDTYLASIPPKASRQDKKERALRAAGQFRSGVTDLGENHDRYLEEAFAE
jgi:hypothetical protein